MQLLRIRILLEEMHTQYKFEGLLYSTKSEKLTYEVIAQEFFFSGNNIVSLFAIKIQITYCDIPGDTTQGWHHGSENLNQIFSTDSPIKLK
jgi:hypothetical protein